MTVETLFMIGFAHYSTYSDALDPGFSFRWRTLEDVRTGLRGTDQTEWERNDCSGAHGASHEADLRTKDATSLSLNPHRDHKKPKQASSQYLLTSRKVQTDLICKH